jgi:hypothetical protein
MEVGKAFPRLLFQPAVASIGNTMRRGHIDVIEKADRLALTCINMAAATRY